MMMRPEDDQRSLHRRAAVRRGIAAIACAMAFTAPRAAGGQDSGVVSLRGGLLIQPAQGVAYVMTLGGGIAAVNLADGTTRWTSRAADRPLTISQNLLFALAVPRDAGNAMELVSLDTRAAGAQRMRKKVSLPSSVRASVGETLHGTFNIEARPQDREILVDWRFVPSTVRGMPDPQEMPAAGGRRVRVEPPGVRGALRMAVSSGSVEPVDTATIQPVKPPRWRLPAAERLAAAGTTDAVQYESADARHVAVSERLDDDRVFAKYRWTIYERARGRVVGSFRSHLSFAPFVVRDSLLFFETTPYAVGSEPLQPAKLRAINLSTGNEAWSVPVQEIVYRGPFPP